MQTTPRVWNIFPKLNVTFVGNEAYFSTEWCQQFQQEEPLWLGANYSSDDLAMQYLINIFFYNNQILLVMTSML